MKAYRKIKLFKFSEFKSYNDCQEAANDYWAELNEQRVDADIQINTDFISFVLKNIDVKQIKGKGADTVSVIGWGQKPEEQKKQDVTFRIKGEDLISAINDNKKVDPDKIITSEPIPVKP